MLRHTTAAAALLRRSALALAVGTSAVALASSWTVPAALAQETSASMTGLILTPQGEPAAGANVEIVHEPTGTRTVAAVNAEGRFSAQGLRVGGPFTVRVGGTGLPTQVIEDVFTRLGDPLAIDLVMQADTSAGQMEEIVVTGERIAQTLAGAGAQFGEQAIARAPTVSRDLKDVIRIDPRVSVGRGGSNEVNIAGSNSRFNSFTVDGIRQGDDFGLNYNGYPTQRAPVSLDSIEQIAVNIAPFDVEYSGFQGGNINVVTKSGTNEFHGSAFYYRTDDSLSGDESKGQEFEFTFDEKTYGATLGGPIIEDTLFFFASYEKLESTEPVEFGPTGSSAANQVRQVSVENFSDVLNISREIYGFDALDLRSDLLEEDEKLLGKIDWNINDQHRAALTYQRTEGNEVAQRNNGGNRVSAPSSWYNRSIKLEQYSGQLFSDWTENFSTELKIGRKEVVTGQDPLAGADFMEARIEIENNPTTSSDDGFIYVGPDVYRHANALTNDLNQYKLKGQYLLGDHTLTAGWEREELQVYNLFVPFSDGQYTFNSIEDFRARRANSVFYQNAVTGNEDDGAADWGYEIDSFYLQDRWSATPDLELTFGLRYERHTMDDEPSLNQNFVARNGFANTGNLDGESLWLPRFGFDYALGGRTTIRGGFGLFGGGAPNVWLSNSFSQDGVRIDTVSVNRGSNPALVAAALDNVDGFEVPAELDALLEAQNGEVNALGEDFELPSSWRYNLAVDHEFDLGDTLGDGWDVTAEAIYTDVRSTLYYRDLRLTEIGTAPDGRPIYQDNRAAVADGGLGANFARDLVLSSTDEGSALVLSLSLAKDWETAAGDFSLVAGYAFTDAETVAPMNDTIASGGFGGFATFDPNNPAVATSNDEIRHRATWALSWSKSYWDDFRTTLSLFGEHRSGRPFSYVFANDGDSRSASERIFGDSSTSARQLFYVPSGPDDPAVRLEGITADELASYLRETGLDEYAGRIAPRNAFTSDWQHTVDLQLKQEIPAFFQGHRATLQLDVFNLTNLINSDWGRVGGYSSQELVLPARIEGGQYVYSDLRDLPDFNVSDVASVWRIQVGVRYEF